MWLRHVIGIQQLILEEILICIASKLILKVYLTVIAWWFVLLSFKWVLKHMLSKKDPALLSWLSQFVVWLTNEKKSILIFRSRRHSRFHFADASLPPRVLFKLQRGSPRPHLCWSDFGSCQLTCLTLSPDHIGGKGLIWSWRADADRQLSQAFDGRRLSSWNAFNYSDQKYTQMFI